LQIDFGQIMVEIEQNGLANPQAQGQEQCAQKIMGYRSSFGKKEKIATQQQAIKCAQGTEKEEYAFA